MNINKNIKMKSTLSALAVVIMACGIMSCNKQPQANDTKETPKQQLQQPLQVRNK